MAYAFDIGSQTKKVGSFVLRLTSAAAGITTASTASMGDHIDRLAFSENYMSVDNVVSLYAVVASTQKPYVTVGVRLEHADSSNSTSFSEYTTEQQFIVGSTVTDGSVAATNYYDEAAQSVNLLGAKRYIRQVVTITPAATCSSGTVQASGVLIFGGGDRLPPA